MLQLLITWILIILIVTVCHSINPNLQISSFINDTFNFSLQLYNFAIILVHFYFNLFLKKHSLNSFPAQTRNKSILISFNLRYVTFTLPFLFAFCSKILCIMRIQHCLIFASLSIITFNSFVYIFCFV